MTKMGFVGNLTDVQVYSKVPKMPFIASLGNYK